MTNVSEIDQQHQELINLLNGLSDAVRSNEPLANIERIIDEVIEYTRFHFAAEERLMLQHGYPELETHMEKHRQLISDALKFKEKLRQVGEHQFIEWFNHWPFAYIHAHIINADRQLEDHIILYGLKNDD